MSEISKQQADAYLESLSRGVSHDVNNVFTLVMSMSEIALSESDVSPNVGMALEKIIKYVEKGWKITKNVAEYGNSFQHSPYHFDLVPFLLKVKGEVLGLLPPDQHFNIEIEGKNRNVFADDNLLSRAVVALCQNAIDSLVESDVSSKEINVKVFAPENVEQLSIEISDNGLGIQEENKDKVFLPFFTTRNRNAHAGMGMTLAQQVARVHGGEVSISAKSKSSGTCINLYIPLGKLIFDAN